MPVNSTHPDYSNNVSNWTLVDDVLRSNVKKYIKDVETGAITDKAIDARNERYRDDAAFTNFTLRTKNGLVGSVFRKDIELDLPDSIKYLELDATGSKMGLQKLAQECVGEVLRAGRFGLLVDYPQAEEGLNPAQIKALGLKARIHKYKAENIINWSGQLINGTYQITFVMLKECGSVLSDDGFEWKEQIQYRELRMINGVYVQRLYNNEHELISEHIPRDYNGLPRAELPFVFLGAEDNDAEVDYIPMLDLAKLNISHLRNSADYEESVHVTGQPTLIISTDQTAQEFAANNPNGVQIGARRGHNLGSGGSAQMLQANPNQLADQAMIRKEEQAVMIGARLIQSASSNETAEAARIKHSGENSVLSTIVGNVESGLLTCIEWCYSHESEVVDMEEVKFYINRTFYDVNTDPQVLMAHLQLLNNNVIAVSDIRNYLRKTGDINGDRTDEDIDQEILEADPIGIGFSDNNTNNNNIS